MSRQESPLYPVIRTVGLSGMLVSFGDQLDEATNRATLAFRSAVNDLSLPGVIETATSLASVFVRFDVALRSHDEMRADLAALVDRQDWRRAPLPEGRRFWRVPTVYGTDLAPQLAEAADAAGVSEAEAIEQLGGARVRVLTIGFAPGQPYLGTLGENWDIPRQTSVTPQVPAGALVVAIRQFVLFSTASPTGWRHVGQTGLRLFQPSADNPFALRAGDELQFEPVRKDAFLRLCDGGAEQGGAIVSEVTS
ncbi:5-oxoprolinase subunit B family protein [Phaeobacter porticola]|uniref:Allophanate hydrolase, subunit 1 n=1 Tax=Phaeobacter porticola TaxID=1844006 RepID=A0A1L3I1V7_9RHOB|nr:allophanate hydrolase subunit 1 [Phaeobacter porticola]APG46078.1 allophanate hydrolase, subunit 1 [Phaeobacter porticola]